MGCGSILKLSKKKPKVLNGKTFSWKYNPQNKMWVKFRKK